MRQISLTCKNHPHLRWSCKEIAWAESSGYNGARSIHFYGEVKLDAEGIPKLFSDKSGPLCSRVTAEGELISECPCSAKDLIKAPEDGVIEEAYRAKHESKIERTKDGKTA